MLADGDDTEGMRNPRAERSLAGLVGDLVREGSRLLYQEIALGRAELQAKLSQLSAGAAVMMIGGLVSYAGFLALLVAAGLGLALVVEPWLAALAVGLGTVTIGAIITFIGKRAVGSGSLVPERTLRSLRKDATSAREWVR